MKQIKLPEIVTITISINKQDAEQFLSTPPNPDELTEEYIQNDVDARIAINKAIHSALKTQKKLMND